MPHSQVSEGVDKGSPDQDPVMASPISDLNPIENPLESDQEEDGWSQAIKQSRVRQEWHSHPTAL